jgi:4-carboxymuconolactone decarboxylase
MTDAATPRLAPLSVDEQTDEQRDLLSALGGGEALHIFSTLVRHPGLFRRWIGFAGKLLQGGTLPARTRELVILRVALRCGGAYEWGQHVGIARDAGISDEEIRCIVAGPSAPGWTSQDAAVLRAVDELDGEHCISDATWNDLSETLDERQMIELTMLSGHYAMLAGTLNSLGVQAERSLPGLGEL